MSTLALLLLATQAAAPTAQTTNVCTAITVVEPGLRPGRGEPTFSARETLDLELRTQVRPVIEGDHLLRLKLLTPRGYLYQTITVPFRFAATAGDESDKRPPTRVVPGYPRPLEVQTLGARPTGRETRGAAPAGLQRRGATSDAATARLPVGGTSITLGSLFGQWTVVPYLDDETAPCGPPRTFVIRE